MRELLDAVLPRRQYKYIGATYTRIRLICLLFLKTAVHKGVLLMDRAIWYPSKWQESFPLFSQKTKKKRSEVRDGSPVIVVSCVLIANADEAVRKMKTETDHIVPSLNLNPS